MQAWLRVVLVWLIALALPVQGIASATMAHCGQSHERMHAASAEARHHQGDGDATAHHHDAAMADGADHAASVQHDAGNPAKFTELGQYKCSSCASCCSAIALPAFMPSVPELGATPTLFAPDVVDIAAIASAGPDRPPRPVLA